MQRALLEPLVQQGLKVRLVQMVQMALPDRKDLQELTVLRELPVQLEPLVPQAQMEQMGLTVLQQRLLWARLRLLQLVLQQT